MTVKNLQSVVASASHLHRLAPNATMWTDMAGTMVVPYNQLTVADFTGSLQTALSLTGKWHIRFLNIANILANKLDHWKLTIDGIVVQEKDSYLANSASGVSVFGVTDLDQGDLGIVCLSSFLFELETVDDDSITINWLTRPIL